MTHSIKHEEYTYKGKPVILDAAELGPNWYETMLFSSSGNKEYAVKVFTTEADALKAYDAIRAAHLPDNERPAPAPVPKSTPAPTPLTGKYAQLRDDLRKAHQIGLEAAARVDDGGTCNMDSPALLLTRWNRAKVEQACKEAGGGCFRWGYFNRYMICLPTPGQARKNETAAEAMTKALNKMGYDAMTYCQMD